MNKYIDHTNLKAFASKEDIIKLCQDAARYQFKAVCVHPYYVSLCKEILKDSSVLVCTVIGFPLGNNKIETKVLEAKLAIKDQADEIDMVINIAALKNKDYSYLEQEIREIKKVCFNKTLKVIIETCYLTEEEMIEIINICNKVKLDYIKTSTGFGTRGASLEDIKIINKYKDKTIKVKASGGIRTYSDSKEYVNLGVSRIGTSNGKEIVIDYKRKESV